MYRCFRGKGVDLEVRNVQVFHREMGGPGGEKCTGVSEGKGWTWRREMYRCFRGKGVDLEKRNVQVFHREMGGPGGEKCTGVSEGKGWTWR